MTGRAVSGERRELIGEGLAAVVHGIDQVTQAVGVPPVVIGGLAVMCRLSKPYRATTDLDLVDRISQQMSQLEVLRSVTGARPVEPAAVMLATPHGDVKVDVIEVRQGAIDQRDADPGDRLHAWSHMWAFNSATTIIIDVILKNGKYVTTSTRMAEPGPLVAMKLQAIMDREKQKQGTDLLDIMRIMLDEDAGPKAWSQIFSCDKPASEDILLHVEHWLCKEKNFTLKRIREAGGSDLAMEEVDLVAEQLIAACNR